MQILYVESVKVSGVVVERKNPPLTTWTSIALKERARIEMEAGGFGGGSHCEESMGQHSKDKNLDNELEAEESEYSVYQDCVSELYSVLCLLMNEYSSFKNTVGIIKIFGINWLHVVG